MRRAHKYHAKPTVVDGIRFDSKKEAGRYQELCLLVRAGEIRDLELQPTYSLDVNGKHICKYRADFRYFDQRSGKVVVEDVKGMITPVYRLKKKLMDALYWIEVQEV